MKKIILLLTFSAFFASCSTETATPIVSSQAKEETHVKTNPRQKRNQHIHHSTQQ